MSSQSTANRFDKGAWILLFVVGLFGLVVFLNTWALLSLPGDGWQMVYGEAPLVAFVGDWPTPLQAGDVVLAVDGQIWSDEWVLERESKPAGWRDGATVPYTILRDGEQQTVAVQLGTLSTRGKLSALAFTLSTELTQYSWLLVGLIVFFMRPQSRPARLLLVAGAAVVFVTKVGWAATTTGAEFAPALLWYADALTDLFWATILFPTVILLLSTFPKPLWRSEQSWRHAWPLLYLIPLLVTLYAILGGRSFWPTIILLVTEAVLIFVIAGASTILTFRRNRDRTARAQVSWLVLGVAISVGGTLVFWLLLSFNLLADTLLIRAIFTLPITLALPICVAIAILRYRLFDIDIIIRRTLQYAIVSALLALAYFGSVILLQALTGITTDEQRPLTIVVSTLFIAALFNPLRRRVQTFIDRRFYRRQYDAQQVLAGFGRTARDEVEVTALSSELIRAIDATIQPRHIKLWMRLPSRE